MVDWCVYIYTDAIQLFTLSFSINIHYKIYLIHLYMSYMNLLTFMYTLMFLLHGGITFVCYAVLVIRYSYGLIYIVMGYNIDKTRILV